MWLRRCPVTVTGGDWRIPFVGMPTRWCTAQQWNKALWDVEEFATPSKILLETSLSCSAINARSLLCFCCGVNGFWFEADESDGHQTHVHCDTGWRERKDYSITMWIQFFCLGVKKWVFPLNNDERKKYYVEKLSVPFRVD